VDERFGGVAVIVRNDGQRFESFGLKAFQRPLTGLAMRPLIGDLGQPLPHLPVHIVETGELAQRPEVLANPMARSTLPFSQPLAGLQACG
jgi:hypothetical protein